MFYALSKLFWVFLSPGNFLVLALLLAGFLGLSHRASSRHMGHVLCFNAALLLFFIGIFPVGDWLLMPLENSFKPAHPDHVDGIILLGGDEAPRASLLRDKPVTLISASRYIEFAHLARDYPQAELVYSGGYATLADNNAGLSQAQVARQALGELGVPAERMIFEEHSHTTRENAVMSADIVHPRPGQKWLLVTSAFHMPRALLTFQKAGWDVLPAPAGYLTGGDISSRLAFNTGEHLFKMTLAVHEYYGLIAYWLMGYTDRPWPG